jgi:ferredoxin
MIRVRVRGLDDSVHEIEGVEGETLLEAMLNAGVAVKATCYGCCNCSTCHVTLGAAWYGRLPTPEEQECDVLELAETRTPTSRLSCQIVLQAAVSGMEVALTEEAAG